MSTIWFPTPVFVLFRRIVNVVSTFSISHHYFIQKNICKNDLTAPGDEGHCAQGHTQQWGHFNSFKALEWLPWMNGQEKLSLAMEGGEQMESPNSSPDSNPPPRPSPSTPGPRPPDTLQRLMNNPVLFDPLLKPRYPIVLCHGLYGFDVRGPASFPMFRTHYWANVLNVLRRKVGAEVIVTGVPGTGSIASRSKSMDRLLQDRARGRAINFIAHSMGGLDCRYLITHIKPTEYTPVSLTTIGTPHRGSPFMDWCMENIGIGRFRKEHALATALSAEALNKRSEPSETQSGQQRRQKTSFSLSFASLPSSFTTLLLSLLDSPAYANLTSHYLNTVFNPLTPDSPSVKYFSVAGRIQSLNIWHPLWLPKMVLDSYEEKEKEKGRILHPTLNEYERWGNDGLVTVQSAMWGEFLGLLEECDHWGLRGARGMELGVELASAGMSGLTGVSSPSSSKPKAGEGRKEDGDGWALGDWGRFVKAWRKEEKKAKVAGAVINEESNNNTATVLSAMRAASKDRGPTSRKEKKDPADDADSVVQASTDKLSAVFDWIVDQVPSRSTTTPTSPPSPMASASSGVASDRARARAKPEKSDLSSKVDLERFYVALCRKLYDEGL